MTAKLFVTWYFKIKMMRLLIILSALFLLTISAENCNGNATDGVYKGRLEVKGICSNITISVVEGNIDTTLVEKSWTDETTNKTYSNAFRLESVCTFPETIKAGEEFYFTIDTLPPTQECIVCMAYYPTPSKKLRIKLVQK